MGCRVGESPPCSQIRPHMPLVYVRLHCAAKSFTTKLAGVRAVAKWTQVVCPQMSLLPGTLATPRPESLVTAQPPAAPHLPPAAGPATSFLGPRELSGKLVTCADGACSGWQANLADVPERGGSRATGSPHPRGNPSCRPRTATVVGATLGGSSVLPTRATVVWPSDQLPQRKPLSLGRGHDCLDRSEMFE